MLLKAVYFNIYIKVNNFIIPYKLGHGKCNFKNQKILKNFTESVSSREFERNKKSQTFQFNKVVEITIFLNTGETLINEKFQCTHLGYYHRYVRRL